MVRLRGYFPIISEVDKPRSDCQLKVNGKIEKRGRGRGRTAVHYSLLYLLLALKNIRA